MNRRLPISSRPALVTLSLALSTLAWAKPTPAQETGHQAPGYQETLDVQLVTVPFYATDRDGHPLTDLAAGEVEISIGGERRAVDSLDSSAPPPPAATAAPGEEVVAPAPVAKKRPTQHVYLLDRAFLSPGSLRSAKRFLEGAIANAAPEDNLFLLVHDPARGLEQLAGPVKPAAAESFRAALAKVKASTILTIRPTESLEESESRGRLGQRGQEFNALEGMESNALGQYRAAATSLATALDELAVWIGRLPGPKVLAVLSDGPSDTVFFSGKDGLMVGSSAQYNVRGRVSEALVTAFPRPLARLAEAGALPVFVNVGGPNSAGAEALRYMSTAVKGLYSSDRDAAVLQTKLSTAALAYYEAGFYQSGGAEGLAGRTVEVRILRPGARGYALAQPGRRTAPGAASDPGAWVTLLVHDGAARIARKPPPVILPGKLAGRRDEQGPHVVFEPDWPGLGAQGGLEIYEVRFTLAPGDELAHLSHLARAEVTASQAPTRFEAALPASGSSIWGLVVVERESGRSWFKRLRLEATPTPAP